VEKAVERIPHRHMQTDTETARQIMNSTLGERLEELRGVSGQEKKKGRGKKIKVAPGKSYCSKEDENREEDVEDLGAVMEGEVDEDEEEYDNEEEYDDVLAEELLPSGDSVVFCGPTGASTSQTKAAREMSKVA
jgi:superfamily II helicase